MKKLLLMLIASAAAPACAKKAPAAQPAKAGDMKTDMKKMTDGGDPCAGKTADPCAGKSADPCSGSKAR